METGNIKPTVVGIVGMNGNAQSVTISRRVLKDISARNAARRWKNHKISRWNTLKVGEGE